MILVRKIKRFYQNKGLMGTMDKATREIADSTSDIFKLLSQDFAWSDTVGIRRRMWLWRHGFTCRSGVTMDLKSDNVGDYVNDYTFQKSFSALNDASKGVLDNKYLFHQHLSDFDEYLPKVYGVVYDGDFVSKNGGEQIEIGDWLVDQIEWPTKLVIKPIVGLGGKEVHIIDLSSEVIRIDGDPVSKQELVSSVSDFDKMIVTDFAHQAEYANQIFAKTANTLRIITLLDPESREIILAAATHRIGTEESVPVDNRSKGGICADIDVDTGIIGTGAKATKSGGKQFFDHHPDTGVKFNGMKIPNWEHLTAEISTIAKYLSELPCVGWDVVVTDDGFIIVEANASPGLIVSQMFGGLLEDDDVKKAFYYYID